MKRDGAYAHLAEYYEYFCDDCDYERWSQYFVRLIRRGLSGGNAEEHSLQGGKGIDFGCGNGIFSRALSREGCRMTGVDVSAQMLSVAEKKTREEGLRISFLQGDLARFKATEKYDFAIAANDVFNYVPKEKLLSAAKNAAAALRPGGVFVADISSKNKFLNKIDGQVSADDREDVTYLSFGKVTGDTAVLDVTLFVRRADGAFTRFDELHTQYVYEEEEIRDALCKAGFEILLAEGMYGEDKRVADRLCFLAKKKQKNGERANKA
ncbi:MAG: class I SAM-dependent methyltransferase [Candidatus Scatosoma sp.]